MRKAVVYRIASVRVGAIGLSLVGAMVLTRVGATELTLVGARAAQARRRIRASDSSAFSNRYVIEHKERTLTMTRLHVVVLACIVALCISTARAQQEHQVLRFEISKDGALIASPELWLQSGMVGRIHLDGRDAPFASGLRERIELTPTVQGENISIAFDITSDAKRFRPSLAISKDVKGALEWVSTEGQTIRLSVSWLPIE